MQVLIFRRLASVSVDVVTEQETCILSEDKKTPWENKPAYSGFRHAGVAINCLYNHPRILA